jgi:hypothetical protein
VLIRGDKPDRRHIVFTRSKPARRPNPTVEYTLLALGSWLPRPVSAAERFEASGDESKPGGRS